MVSADDGGASAGQAGRIARVFSVAAGHLGAAGGAGGLPASAGGTATRFRYPLGKVMGGGSAVNGGLALAARPEDFAAWAVPGNDWWSWDRVQRTMRRIIEAQPDKPALPIETAPPGGLTRCQEAFLASCLELGQPRVDLRQGAVGGVGLIPKSVNRGQRFSTARLYLTAARRRPNLTIRPLCLVDKLVVERRNGGAAASGVEALVDGRRCRFAAERIVLSAGAINSPAILLRSGIGAAAEIARAGGRPLVDLPGVGRNLSDHPAVSIWGVPADGACVAGEPVHQVLLQQRSAAAATLCDLQLFMLSALPTRTLPPLAEVVGSELAVGISAVVATPRSRGCVELVDIDPARSPRIRLNCLQEASDLARMMEGLRSAWRILAREPLGARLRRIVVWNQAIVDSEPLLERVVRSTVRVTWHPAGTLRIGPEGDAAAVVDPYGRLYGCANVTVADASIAPAVPSVPPNLTCMLIGESAAAHLRGHDQG
jgi:choline dehydrogenase